MAAERSSMADGCLNGDQDDAYQCWSCSSPHRCQKPRHGRCGASPAQQALQERLPGCACTATRATEWRCSAVSFNRLTG